MRTRPVLVSAASLAVVSGVVLQSSTAAFTATTSTTGGWAAGTISLTDNDTNNVTFAETGLAPGASGSKCIKVTYTGSTSATVKLYGSISTPVSPRVGGLGPHLTVTVTRGTGDNAACSDFTAAATGSAVFGPGTLSTFTTNHTSYTNGAGAVAVANPSQAHTYKIDWSLSSVQADVQGKDVDATFTWEARTA